MNDKISALEKELKRVRSQKRKLIEDKKMEKFELLEATRKSFKSLRDSGKLDFSECIICITPTINNLARDKENWQIIFDLLYWDWCESQSSISPEVLDKLSINLSPFSDQNIEVEHQQKAADDWIRALNESDISPEETLSLSKSFLSDYAKKEDVKTNIATSSSSLAIPQALVHLYMRFYRSSKMFAPDRVDCIRPLLAAIDCIKKSPSSGEELKQEIQGVLAAKMQQIHAGTAKGKWIYDYQERDLERKAISDFASFLVFNVLEQKLRNDKAQFSSAYGSLLQNACECLYRLELDKEASNG
jgi:hypothetical protein